MARGKQYEKFDKGLGKGKTILNRLGVDEKTTDLVSNLMDGSFRNKEGPGSRSYNGKGVITYEGRVEAATGVINQYRNDNPDSNIAKVDMSQIYSLFGTAIKRNGYLEEAKSKKGESAGIDTEKANEFSRVDNVMNYVNGLQTGAKLEKESARFLKDTELGKIEDKLDEYKERAASMHHQSKVAGNDLYHARRKNEALGEELVLADLAYRTMEAENAWEKEDNGIEGNHVGSDPLIKETKELLDSVNRFVGDFYRREGIEGKKESPKETLVERKDREANDLRRKALEKRARGIGLGYAQDSRDRKSSKKGDGGLSDLSYGELHMSRLEHKLANSKGPRKGRKVSKGLIAGIISTGVALFAGYALGVSSSDNMQKKSESKPVVPIVQSVDQGKSIDNIYIGSGTIIGNLVHGASGEIGEGLTNNTLDVAQDGIQYMFSGENNNNNTSWKKAGYDSYPEWLMAEQNNKGVVGKELPTTKMPEIAPAEVVYVENEAEIPREVTADIKPAEVVFPKMGINTEDFTKRIKELIYIERPQAQHQDKGRVAAFLGGEFTGTDDEPTKDYFEMTTSGRERYVITKTGTLVEAEQAPVTHGLAAIAGTLTSPFHALENGTDSWKNNAENPLNKIAAYTFDGGANIVEGVTKAFAFAPHDVTQGIGTVSRGLENGLNHADDFLDKGPKVVRALTTPVELGVKTLNLIPKPFNWLFGRDDVKDNNDEPITTNEPAMNGTEHTLSQGIGGAVRLGSLYSLNGGSSSSGGNNPVNKPIIGGGPVGR